MKIWTEISRERLAGNFAVLQAVLADDGGDGSGPEPLGPTAVLAVVKANAYGHGIEPCAEVLARAGAEWLGVTDAHEGVRVRAALSGAAIPAQEQPRVLVMSGTAALADEAECIVQQGLTAVVWSREHLRRLAGAAEAAEATVPVHLEVDSGMSRQGVATGPELESLLGAIRDEPRLELDGVFTHFASTEVAGSPQTAAQQASFEGAIAQVAASGLTPRWVHVGNSSYIDNATPGVDNATRNQASLQWLRSLAVSVGARSMVRSGIALYGYLLPIEGNGPPLVAPRVLPVMTWKTRVIGVSCVEAGALIGYSGSYTAERAMRLALLPVGYADGLRRELSSTNGKPGGWVMIRNQQAPIVGRVSMNLTTVDASGIASVAEGDEAVLLGDGITADDHARIAGTIAYEILCGVKTSA